MIITLDCEFNGFGGELISMALVSLDGREFYEVLEIEEEYEPWVKDNVIPFLEKDPIPFEDFQKKLQKYLLGFGEPKLTIAADWPDDIRYLCQTMITGPGYMIKTPYVLNMIVDRTLSSTESEVPHNALYDARAIMNEIKRQGENAL